MEKGEDTLQLINKHRNAIMGVAAIWILFHHEWLPLTKDCLLYEIGRFIRITGFCGVDMFLFLSGMGLVYAIQKHDIRTFYKRRIIRVLIPTTVIAIVMAVVENWGFSNLVKNLLGISFYTEHVYTFLWYAIAIMQFYILFPMYYKFFEKAENKKKFTGKVILLWLILSILFINVIRADLYVFTNRIPVFLIGVYAGWSAQNRKVQFTKKNWITCSLIFVLGMILEYLIMYKGMHFLVNVPSRGIPALLIGISGTVLLAKAFEIMAETGKGIIKFFSFFGRISFELYCVQEWIGSLIQDRMIDNYSNLIINVADFIGVFISCILLLAICKLINKNIKIRRMKSWNMLNVNVFQRTGTEKVTL